MLVSTSKNVPVTATGTITFENNTLVKVNGNTYTITYDFSDDEYGIQFKGSYTGALDVYDYTTEGASLASVKSPAPKKIKKQASALRF